VSTPIDRPATNEDRDAPAALAPMDPASAGPGAEASDEGGPEPTKPRAMGVRIALAAIAVVALVAFLAVSTGALPPRVGNMPPAGEIWFGTRYDPASLVLDDSWTTSPQGRPVAVVAHLVRPSTAKLSVTMTLDGSPIVATTIDVASGHDFVALAPGSILGRVPGTWIVTIADGSGTLASGTLTVTSTAP
jgi:hypothetical protein